jgi:hypothetical protein
MFNKILVAAALTTLIAAPAFADSSDRNFDIASNLPVVTHQNAASSYAQAPSAIGSRSDLVVVGGKVIGQDPDANVRLQLFRDGVDNTH